jgi:hypothetical protein
MLAADRGRRQLCGARGSIRFGATLVPPVGGAANPRISGAGQKVGTELAVDRFVANRLGG